MELVHYIGIGAIVLIVIAGVAVFTSKKPVEPDEAVNLDDDDSNDPEGLHNRRTQDTK